MRRLIARLVDETLDAATGELVDVRTSVAAALPLRVISSLLATPPELEGPFQQFAQILIRAANPWMTFEDLSSILEIVSPTKRLLLELIERRRDALGDDLLSDLIRAEEAGDRLSRDELLSLIVTLVIAGTETTMHSICVVLWQLLVHPEALGQVRGNRALLPKAIDEALRCAPFSKFGANARYALEEVEIGGTRIHKGELVMPLVSAALRDPQAYPRPELFDLHRPLEGTLAFGSGAHFCLGAGLARLELTLVLDGLLDRFSHMELVDREPRYRPHPLVRDLASMQVRLRS
jgi:cytochrome P450